MTRQAAMRWVIRIGAGVAALGLLLAAAAPVFTNDVFWHVATGDYLWAHGLRPGHDPFSFTATDQPWFLHEWLTQVLFAGVHALGGLPGLRVLTGVLTALALWLVYHLARQRVASSVAGAIAVIGFVALAHARFQTRPTLLTIIALLLFVGRLMQTGSPWRWRDLCGLFVLQLLWTNAHSVALVAVPLFGAYLAGRALEAMLARRGATSLQGFEPGEFLRLVLTGLALVAATLCTPSGTDLWAFAWQDKSDVMQYVADEWAPFSFVPGRSEALSVATWLGALATTLLFATCCLASAVALHRAPNRLRSAGLIPPTRVLLMLALFVGCLSARRFHWLGLFVAIMAAETLRDLAQAGCFPLRFTDLRARTLGACAAGVAGVALAFGSTRVEDRPTPLAALDARYWTEPLADFLHFDALDFLVDAKLEGDVVCHYNSGGLITWRGYPRLRVLIDSRIDLYRRAIYLDYVAIRDGRPDQQEILDRYGADIYFRHWEMAPPVDRSAWVPTFKGRDGEVWLRRDAPRTAANLERARAWSAARTPATAPR